MPDDGGAKTTAAGKEESSRPGEASIALRQYASVFRRHRVLFSMPIVLALFLAVWTVLVTPKQYTSTASLWFDNAPPAPSAQTQADTTLRPPAAQQQLVLNELLATRGFRLSVGRGGPLTEYLAGHAPSGRGPMDLVAKLLGRSTALDDRVLSALGPKHVTSTVLGPQVLSISLRGPTPEVAVGTLTALMDQFNQQTDNGRQLHAQASVGYYKDVVAAASTAAATAQKNLDTYVAAHPAPSANDPTFTTLSQAAAAAATRLNDANNSLNQASVDAAHIADSATVRVLDPPVTPTGPTAGRKKATLLAIFAGLFAGCVVSLLGVVALASRQASRARKLDQEAVVAAPVVVTTDPPIVTGTGDAADKTNGTPAKVGTLKAAAAPDTGTDDQADETVPARAKASTVAALSRFARSKIGSSAVAVADPDDA